jgi:hypothetical protein
LAGDGFAVDHHVAEPVGHALDPRARLSQGVDRVELDCRPSGRGCERSTWRSELYLWIVRYALVIGLTIAS